jgi:hypothetical protein
MIDLGQIGLWILVGILYLFSWIILALPLIIGCIICYFLIKKGEKKTKAIIMGILWIGLMYVIFSPFYYSKYPVNCDADKGYNGLPRKYYQDDPCFDVNYRCQVECGNFNRNFTGNMEGCSCDCGDAWVSSCSGFMHMKEPTDTALYINESVTCPAYDDEGHLSVLCGGNESA